MMRVKVFDSYDESRCRSTNCIIAKQVKQVVTATDNTLCMFHKVYKTIDTLDESKNREPLCKRMVNIATLATSLSVEYFKSNIT